MKFIKKAFSKILLKVLLKVRFKKEDDIGHPLYEKFLELLVYIVMDGICFVGFYITLLITGTDYYRSLAYITGILLVLLVVQAGKYLYYYDTKAYQVITGTCTNVEINIVNKIMKKNCVVYMVADNGEHYKFITPYHGILHMKGDRLKIYTSELNEFYKKNGYSYISNIILREKIMDEKTEK